MRGIFFNLTNESVSTNRFQRAAANVSTVKPDQITAIATAAIAEAIDNDCMRIWRRIHNSRKHGK